MRYTGSRNRIARQLGVDLGLKRPGTKSHSRLLKRLNIPPGQHGPAGKKKFSERALQLREKQKLRLMFGLTEKQLKKYFKKASQKKGNTALYLCQYLERRLDNVLYRLGFAPTRASARQLVSHKHIKVNDKILNIPSYLVKKGDIITFAKEKILQVPEIKETVENKDLIIPSWLKKEDNKGVVVSDPSTESIEKQIHLRLVIEYYSR
jgi:small subunit ribosomal protein S4